MVDVGDYGRETHTHKHTQQKQTNKHMYLHKNTDHCSNTSGPMPTSTSHTTVGSLNYQ